MHLSERSIPSERYTSVRSSVVSSHWSSSSPTMARPATLAKRGVSFSHLRRPSVATVSTAETSTIRGFMITTSPIVPRLQVHKPENPSKYIQSEARKVSTELGKAMDEAFNRSSISSGDYTTEPHKEVSEYNVTPT